MEGKENVLPQTSIFNREVSMGHILNRLWNSQREAIRDHQQGICLPVTEHPLGSLFANLPTFWNPVGN
jgi:hypothetical protein